MKGLDWAVLGASLLFIVGYGTWRSRKQKGLEGYLLAGRSQAWWTVKRQAMTTDREDVVGVYFGTTSGEVWGSTDEGETWRCLASQASPASCW